MPDLNVPNRTLFHGDNLPFLRGLNSESVHLIATDPPFNKGRDFHATPDSLAHGGKFQDRWSWDDDVQGEWVDQITDDWPKVMKVVNGSRESYGDDMGAFLCFMAVRLIEMHRVLRNDGSIYLHCDPVASHYLKALMDAIFGQKNFQNEIVWQRTESHNTAEKYGNVADIILFFSKSDDFTWNGGTHVYRDGEQKYSDQQMKRFRHLDTDGRRYRLDDLTAPRPDNDSGKFEWRGTKPGPTRGWGYRLEQLEQWWDEGRIHTKRDGTPRMDGLKVYLDDAEGKALQNIWTDIPRISNTSSERTGYPTQKPLALYRRIIKASSNKGSIVLDPFAGCATTPVAAELEERHWVGADIWDGAYEVVKQRMEDSRQLLREPDPQIYYVTEPPERTDEGEEAAPFLPVKERSGQKRPIEAWQKLTHAQIREHLAEAQGQANGIICAGCGRVLEIEFTHLDHKQPRADGGDNWITNRILLCSPCNGKKSADLTLTGLRNRNKRDKWMRDENLARIAESKAKDKAEEVSRAG